MSTNTASTSQPSRTALSALVLGIGAATLMTVVSFIALVLAAAAVVTGGVALGRGEQRAAPLAGIVLALAAVALFVVEVSG